MRRPLLVSLILATFLFTEANPQVKILGRRITAGGGGGFCSGSFQFCDAFNTTSNPATGWTAGPSSGAWQTNGTQMVPPSGSVTAFFNTATSGTTTQYAIVKIVESSEETGVFVRRTSGTGSYYRLYISAPSTVWWANHASSNESFNQEVSCTIGTAFADGDYFVAVVNGIDGGTTAKVWNWGSSPPTTAPTISDTCGSNCCNFSTSLATVANSGNSTGLYVHSGATTRRFDDFAGGGS